MSVPLDVMIMKSRNLLETYRQLLDLKDLENVLFFVVKLPSFQRVSSFQSTFTYYFLNNGNTKTMLGICCKLTIKTPERHH